MDASFEEEKIINMQMDTLDRLKKEYINFKKDPQDRRTKTHFRKRLNRVEKLRTEFIGRHLKLVQNGLSSDDDYFTNEVCDTFESEYLDIVAQIEILSDQLFPVNVADTNPSSTSPPSIEPRQVTYNITNQELPFKMPELAIPNFSGNYTDWPTFHDSFLYVHNHTRLTNTQKFQYLKNALTSRVKSTIGFLDITADNYDTAWKTLIERYDNKRVLFANYMEKLVNQPSINDSTEELQSLHDTSRACFFAMKKLEVPVEECSEILTFLLIKKLSPKIRLEWEKELGKSVEIPTFSKFIEFLDIRFRTLEAMPSQSNKSDLKSNSSFSQTRQSNQFSSKSSHRKEVKSFHVAAKTISCPMCEQSHVLRKCSKFLQLAPTERKLFVDKNKLCLNCLGHTNSLSCTSTKACFTCGGKHHTLLHFIKASPSSSNNQNVCTQNLSTNTSNQTVFSNNDIVKFAANNATHSQSLCVLLTTAIINVPDIDDNLIRLRALVDQGSQHSVITERASQRLRLPIKSICVGVRPMGETQYKIVNRGLDIQINSIPNPMFNASATVAIMPSVTSDLPLFPVKTMEWPHIQNLPLADPHFGTPGQIDILLAGDVYAKIIDSGLCKGQAGDPIAQNTALGWILFGEIFHQNHVNAFSLANCCHVSTAEIDQFIRKFYELEEVPEIKKYSQEDEWTEQFYETTTVRKSNGKFMVRLPLKSNFDPSLQLGSSYSMALKRFGYLQRRFARDENFRKAYFKVFDEYKQLNQVKLVETIKDDSFKNIKHFYLPHHAVFKEMSITTKLRQVFDASAKSSNGRSLNDILTKGPSLLCDLVPIILNWRTHKFVFIADIEKMYRCIEMHPDDTNYQLVLWQDNENTAIQTYALQTVTFGIVSSPYLAIKTLHTLADMEKHKYPLAAHAIKNQTYMDDVTTGHDTTNDAIELLKQLIQMLRSAGFDLRKYSSNSAEILQHIPNEYHEQSTTCLFNADESVKTLGLAWSTTKDSFFFNVNFTISDKNVTKRNVLSTIARLFDPLGWLNPLITKAKLFLNKLWEAHLDWDEIISPCLISEWKEIIDQFKFINQIEIPRWINTTSESILNEIHIFCDSSKNAYSTAMYLRSIDKNNNIHVNLLIAKSKLTPVRKPLTIPRSELCGAVLAVKLLNSVKANFRLPIKNIFMWTDSSIVLSWIRGDPNRWTIFVSNRIHKILSVTKIEQWHHVISKDNPADLNSRGLHVKQLQESKIWWCGPSWLTLKQENWPNSRFKIVGDDNSELLTKYKSMNLVINDVPRINLILERFSNLNRCLRAIAYSIRFVHIIRNRIKMKSNSNESKLSILSISSISIQKQIENIPSLTVKEIQNSENAIIRWIQQTEFSAEINLIQNQKALNKRSSLFRLNPFLDEENILRVNGRLQNAFMPFNEKFPMIIPAKHRITTLILDFYHRFTLHGGPQVTVNQIRQNFWILNVRHLARNFIHKCVICFKQKPIIANQLMGSLPFHRVNDQTRPFAATIIDYAGPYNLRVSHGRGQVTHKGYAAVFVCMATKAVHLEASGDLSSEKFLATLDRFISRKGFCHDIYSDCGTNFVGGSNEDQRSFIAFQNSISKEIAPFLTQKRVQWHFSPPGAPHFNGLAEAAVKSMKYHFKRIIGDAKLTYEEFSTVLVRIEAVLNSRPISAISDSPNDFTALTPGHFLIGNALLARPQPPADENPVNRYQLKEKMVQHFWQRFRADVLSKMQIRTKWNEKQPNIKVNDLVILKDDRFPVNQWPMGRIVELHPGKDNLIRVATIKIANSKQLFKRPIAKLCLLPVNDPGNDYIQNQ